MSEPAMTNGSTWDAQMAILMRAEKAEAELEALKRDLAMRPSSLTTLYEVRAAMGYNKLTSLDILARDCQSARRILSAAPIPPDNKGLLDLAEDVMRRLKGAEAALRDAANRLRGAGMLSETDEILEAIAMVHP